MRRPLSIFLTVLVILAVGLAAVSYGLPRLSFPKTNGEIRLSDLDAPVDVYRDAYGIPQIYATTQHDLFFTQGYITAQDRFWQMDFWRHLGSGRLSEMFGSSQVGTDKFLRTLGWARVIQQELDVMDPTSLAILHAYADGVNTYLADHKGSALSLEYSVLKLLNPGYQPEPWQPLHTLTWAKAMAWDLGGNIDDEISRIYLMKTLTSAQMADLFPSYPADHPVIVPNPNMSTEASASVAFPTTLASDVAPLLDIVLQKTTALDTLLGPRGQGIGSNNWVISGKLTSGSFDQGIAINGVG